jgi:hypothetical protein
MVFPYAWSWVYRVIFWGIVWFLGIYRWNFGLIRRFGRLFCAFLRDCNTVGIIWSP